MGWKYRDPETNEWKTNVGNTTIPVKSVNGKTGDIIITAYDVGALPSTTEIPSIDGLATKTYVDNMFAEYVTELAALVGGDV